MKIVVIGAGIAGLTAAITFARKGIDVAVLEQADELTELGAGLQLSPNATRILDRIDLLPAVEARWTEIERVRLRSGASLRPIAEVPAGDFARRRWQAPYGVMRRADLQSVLAEAASALPAFRLLLGQRIAGPSLADIRTEISDRLGGAPDLVVGADGVWSALRKAVPQSGTAGFSGYVAWRTTVDRRHCDALAIEDRTTTAFLGPHAHLVIYPLRGSDLLNVVLVVRGPSATAQSVAAVSEETLQGLSSGLEGWHPSIRSMIAASQAPAAWPLYEVSAGNWRADRDVLLIGDAAHAMMPFAAQGAAMAIEDAYDLAESFSRSGPAALEAFTRRRMQRVERVRRRGNFNRFAYHARGPVRLGRNIVLAMRRPESLATDLDWLYGYRTPAP